jgi:glycerophosphoryl diester phosphodiesterase
MAPENTMAAFRAGLLSTADYVECDVRLCGDDTVVMMHDATVNRTTNGDFYLREEPYSSIKKLDAGSWFNPEFSEEYVPTLREVFRLLKGRKRLVVDVKDPDMTYRLMQVLEEEGATKDDVVIFSFQWQVVEESLVAHPDWEVVFLDDELSEEAEERLDELNRVRSLGCSGIGVSVQRIDQDFVRVAQEMGLAVYVYTANHPTHIQKLLDFKVDAIISDRPDGVRDQMNGENQ